MSHMPETAYDAHRSMWAHHAGQIPNGTRVVVLDPQGTPNGSGRIESYDPDTRRYRILQDGGNVTYRYADGMLAAGGPVSPAAIPPAGRHETLHVVPNHRVARGVSSQAGLASFRGNSIVELDAHEVAVQVVLDAAKAWAARMGHITPGDGTFHSTEHHLLAAVNNLEAVQA